MIQTIKDLVSAKADTTVALAREIWGYAELSYEETKSAAALIAALKQEGFTIEEGIADIPTAFTATYQCGSGKPVVGFLAEYDALSGLSQPIGQTHAFQNPRQLFPGGFIRPIQQHRRRIFCYRYSRFHICPPYSCRT